MILTLFAQKNIFRKKSLILLRLKKKKLHKNKVNLFNSKSVLFINFRVVQPMKENESVVIVMVMEFIWPDNARYEGQLKLMEKGNFFMELTIRLMDLVFIFVNGARYEGE